MMDYSCGKFGDCSFCRFCSIVRTDTQDHTQTHRWRNHSELQRLVQVTQQSSHLFIIILLNELEAVSPLDGYLQHLVVKSQVTVEQLCQLISVMAF